MHRQSIVLAAFIACIMLAPAAAHAQEPQPDPAAIAAEQARQLAEASASGPRFQPGLYGPLGGCINEPPESERIAPTIPPGFTSTAVMNGGPGWQVSAPRSPIRTGEAVKLSLRDKLGTAVRWVHAEVTRPDGRVVRAGMPMVRDGSAELTYPDRFLGGVPTMPGTYTVIWRDRATDAFLACDGFEVVP